jgi:hypothetical protein
MYEGEQFRIKNPNWRNSPLSKALITLAPGVQTIEEEVLLAVELLTPITLKLYNRYPMVNDIVGFICMVRGE